MRNESWPQEVGVELQGNVGALSTPPAMKSGKDKEQGSGDGLLEEILALENLNLAYKRVKANGGSHGADGMTVEELLPYLRRHGSKIRQSVLGGAYKPQPVRRVEIPKPDGGVRQLGIPSAVDRVIQQAIAQVLNTIFDKEFSPNSYGFRPGRSAHQAIEAARNHIEAGYGWTVDLDLEKFFDRVNHDKLMSLVARKVKDKRVLKLIRKYLESGIMVDGIKIKNEEGTPQGGPLSPLLANIMLDELDKELERRGHRHCRYADDCNIYVKSRKAGERVMASATQYIEKRLKLKVNRDKSAVDRPNRRKFLGFSFYIVKGKVRNFIHKKCIERFKAKIRIITSRSNGRSMEWRKERMNRLICGWVNYFRLADMRKHADNLDAWIRKRIRMCYWKQWKRIKTKHDNLVKLGLDNRKAWQFANIRRAHWNVAGCPALSLTLTNKYLDTTGFISLTKQLSTAIKF
ncbi:MAG: group II intron reverse transcriptase/maturase [Candidatus Omnitrophica bacterium]|nr:group II intron reverse transcriptase/maturase [Candidatus Omnitrophota bacterium]